VLISVDCLRADHLGAYGYARKTSPRIDQFASQGVVFETAVSSSSYTHPTHMSMLTGLPPSVHGATRWRRLARAVPYIPELLSREGYRVDAVVSGAYLSQNFGFERGFHTYRYIQDPGAERLVDEAIDLLRRGEGQSHFLFLHMFDPHWKYLPPAEFRIRFGQRPGDISDLLSKVPQSDPPESRKEIEDMINLYDGEIAYLDQEVGRLFDELKAMGLYDRSLIIVTADHGEAFFEHGYWEHSQTLYEEMVRIPLIVKWPEDSPVATIDSLVSQTDIFPTVLDVAGVDRPSPWAIPLRRYLDGTSPSLDSRKVVMEVTWDPLDTRRASMKIALRGQDLKYIATLHAPTVDDLYVAEIRDEELYDLRSDPGEKENIIAESSQSLIYRDELRAYLAEARRVRSERRGEKVILDDAVRERLKALGYLN